MFTKFIEEWFHDSTKYALKIKQQQQKYSFFYSLCCHATLWTGVIWTCTASIGLILVGTGSLWHFHSLYCYNADIEWRKYSFPSHKWHSLLSTSFIESNLCHFQIFFACSLHGPCTPKCHVMGRCNFMQFKGNIDLSLVAITCKYFEK